VAEDDGFRAGLAALSSFFVGDASLRETLGRVTELSVEALRGADMAGITMLVEGRPQTAVFTDHEPPEIDSAQYETGVGPCLDAFRNQWVYRMDSAGQDTRWPAFAEACLAHGVHSTMSVPLIANDEGLGALNFYSRRSGAFGAAEEHTGMAFASQAAVAVANSLAYLDARALGESLSAAMENRAVIEQAKGVLMAQGGRSPDQAFELLVRASQRENRKLREVAVDLVRHAQQRPAPAQPRGAPSPPLR